MLLSYCCCHWLPSFLTSYSSIYFSHARLLEISLRSHWNLTEILTHSHIKIKLANYTITKSSRSLVVGIEENLNFLDFLRLIMFQVLSQNQFSLQLIINNAMRIQKKANILTIEITRNISRENAKKNINWPKSRFMAETLVAVKRLGKSH